MDDGGGRFQPVTDEMAQVAEAHYAPVFKIGTEVEIKGSVFRIRKITRKDLVLRLVPGERAGRRL